MADINQVITLGIGTPGAIPEFLTFGLQTEATEAPPVPYRPLRAPAVADSLRARAPAVADSLRARAPAVADSRRKRAPDAV
jgi:hypothetical protein